jgi:hypothetical protein
LAKIGVEKMRECHCATMQVIRAGNEVEVDIDGYVEFTKTKHGMNIVEVEVTSVHDIDAWYDGADTGMDVELTEAERKQAEQLLTDKFREGV